MQLEKLIERLPPHARLLDYGSFGWKLTKISDRKDIHHHGCDIMMPAGKPNDAVFYQVDPLGRKIDVAADYFDLVVASHVLEHVTDPLDLFQELGHVCKPGGKIYIETPSDRSLTIKSDKDVQSHSFYSFWDDPTHIRPWTPAALYRLAVCHGYYPLEATYMTTWKDRFLFPIKWIIYSLAKNGHKLTEALWAAKGWSCFVVIQKPTDATGRPLFKYLSLKDVPRGVESALRLYDNP